MAEYINRDALLKELMLDPIGRMLIKRYNLDGFIKAQPKAEPVKHGKWIADKYGCLHCSECNWCAPVIETGSLVSRRKEYDKSEYCWHCGAKMDGERKEKLEERKEE